MADVCFPLKLIDKNNEKTAEHWFDHYSVEIQKTGITNIPLLNKDVVGKNELVRFRGLISNQLNNEYFAKCFRFRDFDDDMKLDENNNDDNDDKNKTKDIMERHPMIIRHEPNQTDWNKSAIYDNGIKTVNDVVAKFYCHSKSLRICDFVEIFGIWAPAKDEQKEEKGNVNDKQENANDTQESKDHINKDILIENKYDALPTIHVLYWRKIEWNNPLISTLNISDAKDLEEKLFKQYFENASLIRSSLIKFIAKNYLNDDHLLAEYILLHLISEIVSRKNDVMIGNFCLNVRGNFSAFAIKQIYSLLLPYTLNIDLSLKHLNDKRFVPVKNNVNDELDIGILQFTDKSSIIIDETPLTKGKLNKNGLLNIEALKTLINEQKVLYDFEFHAIPFHVNSSICVLSRGNPLKPLSTHCYVYYDGNECDDNQANDDEAKRNDQDDDDDEEDEEEFTLNDYRIYLSAASHLLDAFSLNSKEVCKEIETDFVDLRQKDKNTDQNTLHHRLLIMRLINSSFLNQTNDDDMMNVLKYMQMLEKKREIRNKKFIKTKENTGTKQPASTGTPLNQISEE